LEQLIHKIVKNKPIVGGDPLVKPVSETPVLDPVVEEESNETEEEEKEPKVEETEEEKEPEEKKENETPEKGVSFAEPMNEIAEGEEEEEPTQTGGKTAEFKKGQYVFLRSDGNRQWQIKSVGESFLTVETEKTDDLSDKERIKVVSFLDAIHLRDGAQSHFQEPQQMQPMMMQPSMMYPQQQPVFNIKVVGGSDHSTTGGGVAGQESTIVSDVPSSPQQQEQSSREESSGGQSANDAVDFSRLVVRKEG
jgi:hypothetical protein